MEWNEILSSVLQAVLLVALPPLAVGLYKWIVASAEKLLAEAHEWNSEVTDFLMQAARFAVDAAEQAGIGGVIEDRKEYAVAMAEAWLKSRNIVLDIDLIAAAVEKAVGDAKKVEAYIEVAD